MEMSNGHFCNDLQFPKEVRDMYTYLKVVPRVIGFKAMGAKGYRLVYKAGGFERVLMVCWLHTTPLSPSSRSVKIWKGLRRNSQWMWNYMSQGNNKWTSRSDSATSSIKISKLPCKNNGYLGLAFCVIMSCLLPIDLASHVSGSLYPCCSTSNSVLW